jgi:hypothetical protein
MLPIPLIPLVALLPLDRPDKESKEADESEAAEAERLFIMDMVDNISLKEAKISAVDDGFLLAG